MKEQERSRHNSTIKIQSSKVESCISTNVLPFLQSAYMHSGQLRSYSTLKTIMSDLLTVDEIQRLVYFINNHIATFRKYGRKSEAQHNDGWQKELYFHCVPYIISYIYMHFKWGHCCWRTWHTVVIVNSEEPWAYSGGSILQVLTENDEYIEFWSYKFDGKQYQSYYVIRFRKWEQAECSKSRQEPVP